MMEFEGERIFYNFRFNIFAIDRLCRTVVKIPGYRVIGPGSFPGATRFSEN
jgi:hypothetical protein